MEFFLKLKILSIALLIGVFCLNSNALAQANNTPKAGTTNVNSGAADLKGTNFQFGLDAITNDDINTRDWIRGGVNFILERFIAIMAGTIGTAAVLIMVAGGFMMIISAGRQDMYDQGKAYLTKAAIGLFITLSAYILVTTVQLLVQSIANSIS